MAKQTAFVKKAKELFDQGEREVVSHSDGSVTVKRSYFYRMGMDSAKWSEKVRREMGPGTVEVDRGDHWAQWPKTSYFWVRIREGETVVRVVAE
jgi:hypothetical protein